MIDISWNKDNLKSFENKMDTLIKRLPGATKLSVEDSLKNTQEKALENKKGSKDTKLILTEIIDCSNGKVVGRVYTNKNSFSFAPFLEFGTGNKADGTLPHIGKTKMFTKSGMQFWYAPADKIKRQYSDSAFIDLAGEKIPMNVNFNGAKYVLTYATKPYPFMRPAIFTTRQENADLINEKIGKLLMEVLK